MITVYECMTRASFIYSVAEVVHGQFDERSNGHIMTISPKSTPKSKFSSMICSHILALLLRHSTIAYPWETPTKLGIYTPGVKDQFPGYNPAQAGKPKGGSTGGPRRSPCAKMAAEGCDDYKHMCYPKQCLGSGAE
eukprot:2011796-Amphidinium_carterae.2